MNSRIDLKKLGTHVQSLRQLKGLTQEQLGGLVRVNAATISQLECGRLRVTPSLLRRLARVFDLTEDKWISCLQQTSQDKAVFYYHRKT